MDYELKALITQAQEMRARQVNSMVVQAADAIGAAVSGLARKAVSVATSCRAAGSRGYTHTPPIAGVILAGVILFRA